MCRSSGSRLGRGQDRHGQRHREHGLDRGRAAPDHRVHPARPRAERRGHRHKRRRPAVLERRGHDAHAHQGHPGDDARERDGAHGQAVARLLGRRRPRTTRGSAATSGSWARTGRPSTGPRTWPAPASCSSPTTSTATSRPESASRAGPRPRTRSTATPGRSPITPRLGPGSRGRHLLGQREPGAQEAVRHPHRDARRPRQGPSAAGALVRDGGRRDRGRLGRAPRRLAGVGDRLRVAPAAAPRAAPSRRPGLDLGHALPARRRRSPERSTQPAAGAR